ncbi:unnamed protein product [Meloidogyne enterolobii]|uniref:Uncharacterized protein n=1 Tax=Meloidogyne enterolobii TaxID=390850 RepID=A0ACB0XU95_MELEN
MLIKQFLNFFVFLFLPYFEFFKIPSPHYFLSLFFLISNDSLPNTLLDFLSLSIFKDFLPLRKSQSFPPSFNFFLLKPFHLTIFNNNFIIPSKKEGYLSIIHFHKNIFSHTTTFLLFHK